MTKAQELVSCIMPTYQRRPFVPQAIAYFLRQDYPHRELVIVDDGPDSVRDLVPDDDRIRYIRLDGQHVTGTKRNLACEAARGTLIAHWDDDDWFHAGRLSAQVAFLASSGADLVGVRSPLYYDLRHQHAWRYVQPAHARLWLQMLLYRKSLWREHRFPDVRVASDTHFIWSVPDGRKAAMPHDDHVVCTIHGENVAPKETSGPRWVPATLHDVRRAVGPDWPWYASFQRHVRAASAPPRAPTPAPADTAVEPTPWVVVISAWERPEWLAELLGDLEREADRGVPLDVRVHDDASTTPLGAAAETLARRGWRLVRSPTHRGKREHWRLVNQAMDDLRSGPPPEPGLVCVLPDDVRLCERFFERAEAAWRAIRDPRKAALTVLVDDLREHAACWTGVAPTAAGHVWRTQWLDGAFVAERELFEALDYQVHPVPQARWDRDPAASSGVGRQLSLRLHGSGWSLFRVHDSLVRHREAPSRMTPGRAPAALRTRRFVDALEPEEVGADPRPTPPRPAAAARPTGPAWTVVVFTHERPAALAALLDDLEREAERGVRLDVRVYDDATRGDLAAASAIIARRGWRYVAATHHHGKRRFWAWVRTATRELRGLPSDAMLAFLPDDCRLCERFFERAGERWRHIADPRKIALTVLADSLREVRPSWTRFAPTRIGPVWKTQWVDGAFVSDMRFLDAVGYDVPAVPRRRWERDPTLSSGVGEGWSVQLHQAGFGMYRVHESLVVHVDGPSMMNPGIRWREPMRTLRFVDGAAAQARLERAVPVIAALATIPVRLPELERTVASLLPQVDGLRVYLNGHASVPGFLRDRKIEVATSGAHGDRGDAGKFWWCETRDAYMLTCDDDIVYPDDYAEHLIAAVERYERRAVVGLHGVLVHPNVRSYYRDRTVHHCRRALATDTPVHLVGTGCAAWHTSAVDVTPADFELPNMADIWFGLACQRQRVPVVAIARPAGWLTIQHVEDTIFARHRLDDGPQTRAVRSVQPWRVHRVRSRRTTAPAVAEPVRAAPPPIVAGEDGERTACVIIPVGARRPYLREALASAAAVDVPPGGYEIVVVNDGCRQVTEATVRAAWDGEARLTYTSIPKSGLSAAVNHAVARTRARYVTVLADDDLIAPCKLSVLCGVLDERPDIDVAYSLPGYIDAGGRSIPVPSSWRRFLERYPVVTWRDVLQGSGLAVHGTSTMYRTQVVRAIGGWDEALDLAEEWEFHLRLLRRGHALLGVDAVTTIYRLHEANKSGHFRRDRKRQLAYIYEKLGLTDVRYRGLAAPTPPARERTAQT